MHLICNQDKPGQYRHGALAVRLGGIRLCVAVLSSGMDTGDVAQLGEHRLCKAGVVGSIPIVSIELEAR